MPEPAQLPPDLMDALREFSQWTEKRKENYEVQISESVFHYTDANGLMGIIDSDTLWFTDIRYLNDPSEFRFGRKFALDTLRQAAGEHPSTDPLVILFCQRMLSGLDTALSAFAMFAGSFSKNGDDLGQWRAYSDDGKGFCLGISRRIFTPSELQDDPLKNSVIIALGYEADEAKAEQREGVAQAVELLKRPKVRAALDNPPGLWKVFLQQLSVALAKWIYFVAVGFKHPAYQAEQEVRLLLISETEKLRPYVKMRVRNGTLVPYISWPFSPSLRQAGMITDIRVGPAAEPSAEGALYAHLKRCGISLEDVKIERSTIPYRGG